MRVSHGAGVQIVDDVRDSSEFLQIAFELGEPILLQDGTYLKELQVTDSDEAKRNSLSSRFGKGKFPFHSDTAFWTFPAKWVLLRAVSGDLDRPTHYLSFEELLSDFPKSLVRRSAWICDTGAKKVYTTISFNFEGVEGFRYDPNCLSPANAAAKQIDQAIRPKCFDSTGGQINWIPNRVAIIDNWSWLHARGESSATEQSRILQRIYVQ